MALIDKWPQDKEEFYDNKQWEAKNWSIGEPITKEKLQKIDDGIAILATQVKAILGEFSPESLDDAQLNASRLDNIQEWITGSNNGSYSIGACGTNNIAERLDSHDYDIEKIRGWIGGSPDYNDDNTIASRLSTIESSIETIDSSIETIDSSIGNINYSIENIEDRVGTNEIDIGSIKSWITGDTGYYDNINIKTRINNLENDDNSLTLRVESLESNDNEIREWITGSSSDYEDDNSLDSRLSDLETWVVGDCDYDTSISISITARVKTLENSDDEIRKWIVDNSDYDYENNGSLNERLSDLETLVVGYNDSNSLVKNIRTLESIVGSGATGYNNLTEAINAITEMEGFNDLSAYREILNHILEEIWGDGKTLDNINYNTDSRIDTLNNQINSTNGLLKQIQALATRQNTLEQNLATTNAKIPIEMYIATNSSASDALVISASPRDKSIFFIAIPYGTLGNELLTLQTPDITFGGRNPVYLKKNYTALIQTKYSNNSLISVYRNGSNAYIINVPMAL